MRVSSARQGCRWLVTILVVSLSSVPVAAAEEHPGVERGAAIERVLAEMQHGHPDRAEALVDSILAVEPDHFSALVLRGHLRLRAGDRDAAKAAFERAAVLEPERPEGHHGLGLVEADEVKETARAVLTIRKLFRSDPEKRAREHFERALEIEPTFHDAAIALADLYVHHGGREDYERAIDLLTPRLGDYRLDDMLYLLSRALLGLDRFLEAENILVQLLTRDPEHNGGLLRLTELYVALDQPERASESFRRLTQHLSDDEVVADIRLGMVPIMGAEELAELDRADEPGVVLRRFWNRRDPTPTTLTNERLVDHLSRVQYARTHFGSAEARGFDDRGAIYIRFGKPTERYVSAGSATSRANESWAYERIIDEVLTFDFIDQGAGVFRLTTDLGDALSAFPLDTEDRIDALQEIFQERQHLGPDYTRAATALGQLRDSSSGSLQREVQNTQTALVTYQQASEQRHAKTPVAVYARPAGVDELEGAMSLARFRGGDRYGRIEVAYGLPTPQFSFSRAADGINRAVVEESFALYDEGYEEIARARRQRSLEVVDPESETQAYVGMLAVPPPGATGDFLPPDRYRFAFSVKDIVSNRSKVFWVNFEVPDFDPDSLSMSDLQIARELDPKRPPPALRPYPYTTVVASERLYVRYEVYGLTLANDGLSDFHVTYTVESPSGGLRALAGRLNPFGGGGAGGIAIDADRRGTAVDERDLVELDLGELAPGTYRLTVRVEDRLAGRSASSSIEIDVRGNP